MKLIKQGAEAIIYIDENKVVKNRISKNYRIEQIDNKIRRLRTKREAKIIEKASVNTPKIFNVKNEIIEMEFIDGELVKNFLDKLDKLERLNFFRKLGGEIRKLHDQDIIHGDLTTSNLILKDGRLFFIDFGLGFFSSKVEDKAVDVYLFKQVIKSRHYKSLEDFNGVLEGYGADKEFLNRLEKIEGRGRYKKK